MNPGNMNTKIDKNERAVAVWYVLLAALEDVETQRRGFCFLVNPKTLTIRQVKSNRWLTGLMFAASALTTDRAALTATTRRFRSFDICSSMLKFELGVWKRRDQTRAFGYGCRWAPAVWLFDGEVDVGQASFTSY